MVASTQKCPMTNGVSNPWFLILWLGKKQFRRIALHIIEEQLSPVRIMNNIGRNIAFGSVSLHFQLPSHPWQNPWQNGGWMHSSKHRMQCFPSHEAVNRAREELTPTLYHLNRKIKPRTKKQIQKCNCGRIVMYVMSLNEDSHWNFMFRKLC